MGGNFKTPEEAVENLLFLHKGIDLSQKQIFVQDESGENVWKYKNKKLVPMNQSQEKSSRQTCLIQ